MVLRIAEQLFTLLQDEPHAHGAWGESAKKLMAQRRRRGVLLHLRPWVKSIQEVEGRHGASHIQYDKLLYPPHILSFGPACVVKSACVVNSQPASQPQLEGIHSCPAPDNDAQCRVSYDVHDVWRLPVASP